MTRFVELQPWGLKFGELDFFFEVCWGSSNLMVIDQVRSSSLYLVSLLKHVIYPCSVHVHHNIFFNVYWCWFLTILCYISFVENDGKGRVLSLLICCLFSLLVIILNWRHLKFSYGLVFVFARDLSSYTHSQICSELFKKSLRSTNFMTKLH